MPPTFQSLLLRNQQDTDRRLVEDHVRLAREMASMAQEADDRERILDLFGGVYSQETLRNVTELSPTIDSVAGA